jgi:hypothetical protein
MEASNLWLLDKVYLVIRKESLFLLSTLFIKVKGIIATPGVLNQAQNKSNDKM